MHAAASTAPASILRALSSAEAFFREMFALGLPLPLGDGERGGDARYDLYLLDEAAATIADPVLPGEAWDRASAFSVLPPPSPEAGCDVDAAIARAIGQAMVLGVDAGAESVALAMASSYLASSIVDCGIVDVEAVDDFQRDPERSFTRFGPEKPAGSMLFARFLEDRFGVGWPGGVLFGLLSVAGQATPASALFFANEPDVFDALRSNVKARGAPLAELLADFAVARAFVGSRSDGAHLSDVDRFGALGRPRFEWSVPWSSLPRRLAPMRPIEPTGATYLWLDLSGAEPPVDLTFVADWELGVLFQWSIAKVDREGAEAGRIEVAGINGATRAERSLVGLQGLSGLLIVGVNAGSIDRSRPFDPDEGPELGRGYTVTLMKSPLTP